MTKYFLTFVLVASTLSVFSQNLWGQTNTNQAEVLASDEATESQSNKTRLSLDTISAQASTPSSSISFTAYTLGLEQEIFDRLTVQASVPLIMGSENNDSFAMWGNAFFAANFKLLKLQDFHPLWFSVHGGYRFAKPEDATGVTARYEEIHTGASLIKNFKNVSVITDADYVQKENDFDLEPTVGNELDAYCGVKVNLEDWFVQSGFLVRHADPMKDLGRTIVGEDLFTAVSFSVGYHISPNADLTGRLIVPTASSSSYLPNLASFGDLMTQATIGRSWGIGVNLSL